MVLTVATQQPNFSRLGPSWVYVAATSAEAATSDGLETTYVQLTARCLLDSQVLRLGFPIPTLPAGAKVYSVGVRRKIRALAAGSNRPICAHWFRSSVPATPGTTTTASIAHKYEFTSVCPVSLDTTTPWVEESIATFTTAPDGSGWDVTTNLASFTYDMGRADSYGNLLQVAEVWLEITYQQQSSLVVDGPATPTADTRPAISWTYSSADSQPQQAYRVALYTLAQTLAPGFEAFATPAIQGTFGLILGDDSQWIPNVDLADGDYVVYVQAQSKWGGLGDFFTPVASRAFTRTASTGGGGTFPPNATLSSAVFSDTNNRVALTMVPSSASPVTTSFTVFVAREGEVTFTPIPSLTYIPANGMSPVTEYDYVAPINATSQYKVLAYGPSTTTPVAAAAFSSTLPVTTSGDRWWLKDPQNPLANTPIPVLAKGNKIMRRRIQGTFEVLSGNGNVKPIVINGPVYGETGTLMLGFRWDEPDYFTAWDQLDKSGHVLLLQKPTGEQLFVTLGPGSQGQETTWEYESVDATQVQWRKVTVSYTEVGTPSFY